jgi:hypothetical protein
MWSTLAVVAAVGLAPAAEPDQLTLRNVRITYGTHGPERTNPALMPGDSLSLSYDIEGISADPNGKVLYSTAMEIIDKSGKVLFKQDPQPLEATLSLGGNSLPAFAHLDIGLEQQPGDYTVRVTVTDRLRKKPQTLSRQFTVLKRDFALVRLTTTGDPQGQSPTAVPGVGEVLWLNFALVNFERSSSGKKQPNVKLEMRVYDETGKPTVAQPFHGEINDKVPEKAPALQGQFLLSLNRAGKFTVELKATDQISKKTSAVSFPLTVVAPK